MKFKYHDKVRVCNKDSFYFGARGFTVECWEFPKEPHEREYVVALNNEAGISILQTFDEANLEESKH